MKMLRLIAKAVIALLAICTIVMLAALFTAQKPLRTQDYGNLARYRSENRALVSTLSVNGRGPQEIKSLDRIVFFGDSIIDLWDLQKSFPGKPYVNRGIRGQLTSQMLLRFHQDVIALSPKAVVILAGANDLDLETPLGEIESNYAAMAEMARANQVAVLFGSVLPVNGERYSRHERPERIAALNQWLRRYCESSGATFIDYWSRMSDGRGLLLRELSDDGLHPNAKGYEVMRSVVESQSLIESRAANGSTRDVPR